MVLYGPHYVTNYISNIWVVSFSYVKSFQTYLCPQRNILLESVFVTISQYECVVKILSFTALNRATKKQYKLPIYSTATGASVNLHNISVRCYSYRMNDLLVSVSYLPSYSYDVVECIGVVGVEIVQFCLVHI